MRAEITELFKQGRLAIDGPDNRRGVIGRDGLQGMQHVAQFERAMFVIDHEPVKPGPGQHLVHRAIGDPEPEAKLRVAGFEAGLESVARQCAQTKLTSTVPSDP